MTNAVPGKKLGAALRFSYGHGVDVTSFPSPECWIPLPASGAGPPVYYRRWTPNTSPHPDCWASLRRDDSAVPILERHWPGPILRTPQPGPVQATHDRQTETPTPDNVTPMGQSPASPIARPALLPRTVTARDAASLPGTVTRPCVGCGMPLEGKRPQARSHGDACRQRAYRRRKRAAAEAQVQRQNGHRAVLQDAGLAHVTAG